MLKEFYGPFELHGFLIKDVPPGHTDPYGRNLFETFAAAFDLRPPQPEFKVSVIQIKQFLVTEEAGESLRYESEGLPPAPDPFFSACSGETGGLGFASSASAGTTLP